MASGEDVLNRIYVGIGFTLKSGSGPEKLIEALEPLLRRRPDLIALLEFTSPGDKARQIDCALVGPGGIDLIEVKNYHGFIQMSADGAWSVQSGNRIDFIQNKKWGRPENPYDQAFNAANDLKKGIGKRYGRQVRVTPLVFLPSADARTKVVQHFNVGLALGGKGLAPALRSAPATTDGGWDGLDYHRLPQDLGLSPLQLSFLRGRVVSAVTHQGIEHLQVAAEVDQEQQITTTDALGYYSFCVQLGSEVSVGYVVPQQFETPRLIELKADARILTVPEVQLSVRPANKTEAEIRDEVMREMQERVDYQARQTEAAWENAQVQAQLVLDDLTRQLVQLQLQLNERERQLRQYQQTQNPVPLAVRVVRESQVLALEEQQAEVAYALEHLKTDNNAQQKETFNESLALITRLTGELRQPLPTTTPLTIQVEAQERLIPEETGEEEAVSSVEADTPATHQLKKEPIVTPPLQDSGRTESASSKPYRWWPVVAAALVGLLGLWSLWRTPIPAQSTVPVSPRLEDRQDAAPQLPDTQQLPGEALNATDPTSLPEEEDSSSTSTDTQSAGALPGEPLR